MRTQLNIGIDADGVIFDLFKFQIEKGLKHFKKPIEEVDINKYDIQDIFDCTRTERQVFWAMNIYDYCMNSETINGMIETIKKLRADGHKVYNITSRVYVTNQGPLGKIFRAMLEKRYEKEGVVFDGIDYCSEKESARDKMLACHKRQIDIMLEDKIDNIQAISKLTKVLCFDNPWNKNCEGENIVRVRDGIESYKHIDELSKELFQVLKDKNYVVNGKFKRLRPEQEAQLTQEELKHYYKQRKNYYMNLPYDEENIKKQERNYGLAYKTIIPALNLYYNPKIINKELIPYQNGVIFVSNHLGSLDQFPIIKAIGNKPIHFLVAQELLDLKRGTLYKNVGSVFVDRNSVKSRYQSLETLTQIVSNNGNIFIFPEGTRNRNPEKYLLDIQNGPVMIAQITGAPIVPFTTNGNFNFRSKDLIVRVGEPILVKPGENLDEANNRLRDSLSTMIWENMELEKEIHTKKKIKELKRRFPIL